MTTDQLQTEIDGFFHKIQEIKSTRSKFINTINIAERLTALRDTINKYGMSKSLVNYIQTSDVFPLLEKLELTELIDADNYDYTYTQNDNTKKIYDKLSENITPVTDLRRSCFTQCNDKVKEAKFSIDKALTVFSKQISKLKEELSNTTKSGIPSKLERCQITVHQVDDNGELLLDEPIISKTMSESGYDKNAIINLLDKAVDTCNTITKEKIFLSENLDEMLEILNRYQEVSKRTCVFVSEALTLGTKYKNCC